MRLLPRGQLLKTSDIDQGDWNYRPVIGFVQRLRFRLVCRLLDRRMGYQRILEVGYGSGIFMPELAARSRELYGIDIHPMANEVTAILANQGVKANLFSGSIERIPLPDNFLDCVVAISTLEFVPDLNAAIDEIKRVLKPDGNFVVVTPGTSKLLDAGLFLLTGRKAKRDFALGRDRVLESLRRFFDVEVEVPIRPLGHSSITLYHGLCVSITKKTRRKMDDPAESVVREYSPRQLNYPFTDGPNG